MPARSFASPVTAGRWEQLKQKWALDNVDNLRKQLSEPEKFKRFKDSTRIAEDNLHAMEQALADRLELSGVQRKRIG